VLTRDNYAHVDKLGKKLADGYRKTIAKVGLQAYIAQAGANGALMFYPKEIRNYRDWTTIDIDLWRHYWFGMVNRGVMAQPYWWDEQWTISVQHTDADIDKHLSAFDDIAVVFGKSAARTPRPTSPGRALKVVDSECWYGDSRPRLSLPRVN
jgi:glutamate-1-semialdehyde 2,1-aminomutase